MFRSCRVLILKIEIQSNENTRIRVYFILVNPYVTLKYTPAEDSVSMETKL